MNFSIKERIIKSISKDIEHEITKIYSYFVSNKKIETHNVNDKESYERPSMRFNGTMARSKAVFSECDSSQSKSNHMDALRALEETYNMLCEPRLAEKLLKDAAKLDPNCPRIW
uniref:Uncharacterized protein n=1 Tax=Glossina palpalis gambiensis TaxID=67801 RepID=A0A1B0BJD6_9MUSC